MRSVLIEGRREDTYRGHVQVRVEPSVHVSPGIYISVNDHFELASDPQAPTDATEAINVLELEWDAIVQRAPQLIGVVMNSKPSESDRQEAIRRAAEHDDSLQAEEMRNIQGVDGAPGQRAVTKERSS